MRASRLASTVLAFGLALLLLGQPAAARQPQVLLNTSMGEIVLELNLAKAPVSVENFLQYVKSGHYDNTLFHRVIDGFMIQGGGFAPGMKQKPTRAPIANESKNGLKNTPYSVAMARTSIPDSATAQFFINVVANPSLDYPKPDGVGYAVFGQVVKGQDVVDRIKAVKTGRGDVPVEPVLIRSATLID